MKNPRRQILTTIMLLLSPAFVSAQQPPEAPVTSMADMLRTPALQYEQEGNWESALDLWTRLYRDDRKSAEYRDHMRIAWRRVRQRERHHDGQFQAEMRHLTIAEVRRMYAEALKKVSAVYYDRTAATLEKLVAAGVDELAHALEDSQFRMAHVPHAKPEAIIGFVQELRDRFALQPTRTVEAALKFLEEAQVIAFDRLGWSRRQAQFLTWEMLVGACNALDEYSGFVSPEQTASELSPIESVSVNDVGFLHEGVGYLRIHFFQESTPAEVDEAIDELRMNGSDWKYLIVDLRGNPGGSFSAAVATAERFLPSGIIATTTGQQPACNRVYEASRGAQALDVPMIVLIDGATASAAEVLAASLRDHKRATLIGEGTFGKGAVQTLLRFAEDDPVSMGAPVRSHTGSIRLTLAEIATPKGVPIAPLGIAPHVAEVNPDKQLPLAIDRARKALGK